MAPERMSGNSSGNYLSNIPNVNLTSVPNGPPTVPYHLNRSGQNPLPPPVPPRQQPAPNYSGYSSYGQPSYYGGYGYGNQQYRGFGGFGGFGGLGGLGGYSSYSPYSSYNNNNYGSFSAYSGNTDNRLLHYIEANARPTFHSIETVLHAFSSMTMLLESTYFALTNSFRAILSVAESMGKLRSTINQLFGTLATIRFVKWLYRKIVVRAAGFRGSQYHSQTDEDLWDKSLAKIGEGDQSRRHGNESSLWTGLLMFSVFIAIPYMIHKIVCSIRSAAETRTGVSAADPKTWYESEEPAQVATVLHDFVPVNRDELGVKAGQKICLAPMSLQPKQQMPGWCIATDNVNVGLVPYNHIKILGQLKKVRKGDDGTARSPAATRNEEKSSSTNENVCTNQEEQQQQQWRYNGNDCNRKTETDEDDSRFDQSSENGR